MVSKANGSVTQTNVFAINEPFYLIVDLTSAPADTVSKVVWYAANAAGIDSNTLIDDTEFQGNGEVTFDLSNNGPWPLGTYKVEVYVNNVLDRTVQFTVAETSGATGGTTSGSGSVEITNAFIARKVNEVFEKIDVYSSDEVFWCYLELSKVSPNTKFKAEWKAINAEGWDANSSLYVAEGNSASDAMAFDLGNPNPWGKGKYGVDIYMDDVLQRSLEFSVE